MPALKRDTTNHEIEQRIVSLDIADRPDDDERTGNGRREMHSFQQLEERNGHEDAFCPAGQKSANPMGQLTPSERASNANANTDSILWTAVWVS